MSDSNPKAFENDVLTNRAIEELLRACELPGLWDRSGPTDEGWRKLQLDGGSLSWRKRHLLFAIYSFARREPTPSGTIEIVDENDGTRLLGMLAAAQRGSEDLEQWVAEMSRHPRKGSAAAGKNETKSDAKSHVKGEAKGARRAGSNAS